MTQFIRPVDKHVENLLIIYIEALSYLFDKFHHHIPYFLRDSKLDAVSCCIFKESADGLIVGETPCGRKQVVLHGGYGSHGDLRGEVAHLVFPKSEILLAVLEHDFQRPPHGIYLVCLKEVELAVGSDKPVPLRPFAAPAEEKADISVCELHVYGDMVASQHAAVLAAFLGLVEECHELVCRILLAFIHILGSTHFNHAQIVALCMPGSYELDDFGTGEPAVCQNVVKVYLVLDDAAYHLYHQRDFALVILLYALGGVGLFGVFLGEPCVKLLLLQAVILFLALLPDKREVKQHLAPAVSDAQEKSLEAEYHGVCHMGEHLPDKFCLEATLRKVSVINHQAYGISLLTCAVLLHLAPKLPGNNGENLAPVIGLLGKESVERVTLAGEHPEQ